MLVLRPGRRRRERFVLFVRPRDPRGRSGPAAAPASRARATRYGADAALPDRASSTSELPDLLARLRARSSTAPGVDADLDRKLLGCSRACARAARRQSRRRARLVDPRAAAARAAAAQDARASSTCMRRAAAITAEAHRAAMRARAPGHERVRDRGAGRLHVPRAAAARAPATRPSSPAARTPPSSTTSRTTSALRDGDLLLIDAGCEVDGYTADVTRTFPVGGRFTPTQRAVYEVVLAAQLAAIAHVRPGAPFDVACTSVALRAAGARA